LEKASKMDGCCLSPRIEFDRVVNTWDKIAKADAGSVWSSIQKSRFPACFLLLSQQRKPPASAPFTVVEPIVQTKT